MDLKLKALARIFPILFRWPKWSKSVEEISSIKTWPGSGIGMAALVPVKGYHKLKGLAFLQKKSLTIGIVRLFSCGAYWIRTSDPLLVRQVLWTSWANTPCVFSVTVCYRFGDANVAVFFECASVWVKKIKKNYLTPISPKTWLQAIPPVSLFWFWTLLN